MEAKNSLMQSVQVTQNIIENREDFPCFCQVVETREEDQENEKYCGNTSRKTSVFAAFPITR